MNATELYLYSGIYSFVAQDLISQMQECGDDDITLRVNSPGGSVLAGWGIIAKMRERTAKTNIKVDGAAMSMACYALAFADSVECLDVSKFMLHPADMYVSDETDQAFLDSMNKDLRAALEARIDSAKMKALTGYSIADMFENKDTPDIHFGADVAKKIGLVHKITKLLPAEASAMTERYFRAAATHIQTPPKSTTMDIKTLDELKAAFPILTAQLHDEAYASGRDKGKKKENERVMALMAYYAIDPKAVKKMIKKGKKVTAEFTAEMDIKGKSPEALARLSAEAAKPIHTEQVPPEATAEEKKKADELKKFEEEADKIKAHRSGQAAK